MAKHAKNAKVANRRKEINHSLSRNAKAAMTGKYENLNTGLLIAGTIGYILRFDIRSPELVLVIGARHQREEDFH